MKYFKIRNLFRAVLLLCLFFTMSFSLCASNEGSASGVDVKEIVLGHMSDAYEWHTYIMKQGGKRAIGFYLIDKVVRLVFVVFLIIVYALADCSSLLAFSMSLLAFYLVSMVTSIIFYVKVEQNLSKKQ